MLRVILFLSALLALPVALIALLRSGRRPAGAGVAPQAVAAAPAVAAEAEEAAPPAEPSRPPEVTAAFHELAFGTPFRFASDQPAHRDVAAAVDIQLTGPVLKPEYAPRRPLLLPKLVQAVNDENVSRRELSVLIAQDPALAGNLLRLANSAMYRVSAEPVESIDRAVALLGTSGIRSLMAAALLQPVFRSAAGELKRFPEVTWEHTQYSASAAEAYAAIIADEDPFAAQLLALLFGLGTILTFRASMDEYASRGAAPDTATVAALVDQHSATVASRVAHEWELSARMLTALEEQSPYSRAGVHSGLGQALGFGRYCGKVAVLRHARRYDDDGALAAMRAGYPGPAVERIWARLAKQLAG
jgi:HD-like signal output (HDOD) protein